MINKIITENNRKLLLMIGIFLIIVTIAGGTYAYLNWQTSEGQKTNIVFTQTQAFSCAVDGGGNITETDVVIMPTTCMSEHAIKREITVTPTITQEDLTIDLDLWINVNKLDSGLANSEHFKYVLTTSANSCTSGVIASGNFNGYDEGDTISILDKVYNNSTPEKYYLYIWLEDVPEMDSSTMNQTFNLSLGGNCTDALVTQFSNVTSVETLKDTYDFDYYSTLNGAVNDVNNNTIGVNADSTEENAVAGVYASNGENYVVLLKDSVETTAISPSVDMTINLGGHILSSNDVEVIDVVSGDVTIDGKLSGSTVLANSDIARMAVNVATGGSMMMEGGSYICDFNSYNVYDSHMCVRSYGNLNVSGVMVISSGNIDMVGGFVVFDGNLAISNCYIESSLSSGNAYAVSTRNESVATVSNSKIIASTKSGMAIAFDDGSSSVTISDSYVVGYSNYERGEGDSGFISASNGIQHSKGDITLNNNYVMGVAAGIQSKGSLLYINGGTYESWGAGGILFAGDNTVSYLNDVVIRHCNMPSGYTANVSRPSYGFKLENMTGGNNSIYMDNCDIYGDTNSFTLEGSNMTGDNNLYISNSSINLDKSIAINYAGNYLHIGAGNNFTSVNTTLPSAVTTTNEVYRYETIE